MPVSRLVLLYMRVDQGFIETDTMRQDHLRSYLTQTRCELALRLCDRLYPQEQVIGPDGQPTGQLGPRATKPSKWWMSFQKRRCVPSFLTCWYLANVA